MGHLTAAVVQAATIVGIPTAVTSVELAAFALCARLHSSLRQQPARRRPDIVAQSLKRFCVLGLACSVSPPR